MPNLQTLSKCFTSLAVFLTNFVLHMQACNYVMLLLIIASCQQYFKLNSNKPINVIHLPKLANQSILNGALVIEK